MDRQDPGFHPDANLLDIRITLDGKVLNGCLTADSDKGEVLVFTGYTGNGEYVTEVLYGKVEIIENGTERRL